MNKIIPTIEGGVLKSLLNSTVFLQARLPFPVLIFQFLSPFFPDILPESIKKATHDKYPNRKKLSELKIKYVKHTKLHYNNMKENVTKASF